MPTRASDVEMRMSRKERDRLKVMEMVGNDYTIGLDGRSYQIEAGERVRGLAGRKVGIERRVDGTVRVRWGDRYLRYRLAMERESEPQAGRLGVGVEGGLRPPPPPPSRHPSNPNINLRPITLGESGHCYFARNRTFLLCVDTKRDRPALVGRASKSGVASEPRPLGSARRPIPM